jgi:hypothetical protein
VLAPYDLSVHQMSAREREAWANRIAVELTDRFPAGTVLWFHTGALYLDAIASVVPHQVHFPLAGLGIGQQLAWYRRHAFPDVARHDRLTHEGEERHA